MIGPLTKDTCLIRFCKRNPLGWSRHSPSCRRGYCRGHHKELCLGRVDTGRQMKL